MDKQEFYWSIAIEPRWVQAGLWSVENQKTKVYAVSKGAAWDSFEDLLHATDASLSSLVDSLPESVGEPSKTVFGISPSWVDDGQIKNEQVTHIKEISRKLSLVPGGFVVLPEGIAHMIKIEEGSPLSGLIIGVHEEQIDITLFRLGNLVGTVNVVRSVSIEDDVVEGLTRFGQADPFPSRILIYNGREGELEEAKQALIKTEWSEKSDKIKFLHTPNIEIVSSERKVVAVSIAGAFEMAGVEEMEVSNGESEKEESNVAQGEGLSASDVGFVVGEDVSQVSRHGVPGQGESIKKKILSRIPKFGVPKIPMNVGRKRVGLLAAVALVLLVVGGGVFLWTVPKAEVSIFVSPKNLEGIETVFFDENTEKPDIEGGVIPAKFESVTVSGENSRAASGSKTVGEKAKGTVTVRNGTSQSVQLAVNAVLTGTGDLRFRVVESASVSGATSPSEPGSSAVEVEADDIGAEYNLAEGESLSVSNFPKSEVDAIVEGGFSGGSSREIVAVSQADLDSLEDALSEELQEEGIEKVQSSVGGGRVFVPESIDIDTEERQFSHRVGDEAQNVDLKLEIAITGVSVSKSDLGELARAILQEQIPGGFSLRDEQVDYDFEFVEQEDGVWEFEVGFVANLLPFVNLDEVSKKLAGKSVEGAERLLRDIAGFSGAEIKVRPPLPGFFGRIPRNSGNISLEVVAEK